MAIYLTGAFLSAILMMLGENRARERGEFEEISLTQYRICCVIFSTLSWGFILFLLISVAFSKR